MVVMGFYPLITLPSVFRECSKRSITKGMAFENGIESDKLRVSE